MFAHVSYPLKCLATLVLATPLSVFAASCADAVVKDRMDEVCNNPYVHPNQHKDAILRLVYVGAAIAEEASWARRNGVFGIRNSSRLPVAECKRFFQDVISLRNIEVISEGAKEWGTINRGSKLPTLDPNFKEWRFNERRQVVGYVVVRWRGKEEFLIRARRKCSGSVDDIAECKHLSFQHLDAHDGAGPNIACSAMTVGTPYWHNWRGSVTPVDLNLLNSGGSR